jgi:hypothetical protein
MTKFGWHLIDHVRDPDTSFEGDSIAKPAIWPFSVRTREPRTWCLKCDPRERFLQHRSACHCSTRKSEQLQSERAADQDNVGHIQRVDLLCARLRDGKRRSESSVREESRSTPGRAAVNTQAKHRSRDRVSAQGSLPIIDDVFSAFIKQLRSRRPQSNDEPADSYESARSNCSCDDEPRVRHVICPEAKY